MKRTPHFSERFDQSYEQLGDDECWNWTECMYHNGYGRFSDNGRWYLAHRLSYTLNVGPVPRGMVVMHSCNNKRCVNPFHLEAGTVQQNVRDALRDGLRREYDRRGTRNPKCKLNEEEVRAIRDIYGRGEMTSDELGYFFEMSGHNIMSIVHRQTWKHVA